MKSQDLTGARTILAAAAGAVLLGTASSALAAPTEEPLATLYVDDTVGEVWWDRKPQMKSKSAVLTVSAPNSVVTEATFAAGEDIVYTIDPAVEDGTYTYEMYGMAKGRFVAQEAMPEGSPGAIDANGRPSNANAANPPQARRGTVQFGSFSVDNGGLVDPSLLEVIQ